MCRSENRDHKLNFACRKCEMNIGEAVEQEEKLCNEVETV